jgi:hypothetical protein
MYLGFGVTWECSGTMELCLGEDQQAAELMVVEVPDRVQEITIESHGDLGHRERREQPSDLSTVGESPPVRRGHPIGVVGAEGVAVRLCWPADVVEPYQ